MDKEKIDLFMEKAKSVKKFTECMETNCASKIEEVRKNNSKKLMELQTKRFYAKTLQEKEKLTEIIKKVNKEVKELKEHTNCRRKNCHEVYIHFVSTSVKYWNKYYKKQVFSKNKIAFKQLNDLKKLVSKVIKKKEITEDEYDKLDSLYWQLFQVSTIYDINLNLDIFEIMKSKLTKKQKGFIDEINDLMKGNFSMNVISRILLIFKEFMDDFNKDPKNKAVYTKLLAKSL